MNAYMACCCLPPPDCSGFSCTDTQVRIWFNIGRQTTGEYDSTSRGWTCPTPNNPQQPPVNTTTEHGETSRYVYTEFYLTCEIKRDQWGVPIGLRLQGGPNDNPFEFGTAHLVSLVIEGSAYKETHEVVPDFNIDETKTWTMREEPLNYPVINSIQMSAENDFRAEEADLRETAHGGPDCLEDQCYFWVSVNFRLHTWVEAESDGTETSHSDHIDIGAAVYLRLPGVDPDDVVDDCEDLIHTQTYYGTGSPYGTLGESNPPGHLLLPLSDFVPIGGPCDRWDCETGHSGNDCNPVETICIPCDCDTKGRTHNGSVQRFSHERFGGHICSCNHPLPCCPAGKHNANRHYATMEYTVFGNLQIRSVF